MRELLKFIAFLVLMAALLVGVLRAFFVTVVETNNYSMVPTLVAGDAFLVFTRAKLGRGDVAVCSDPEEYGRLVVGRVMAVAGDTLAIRDDVVRFGSWDVESTAASELTYVEQAGNEKVEKSLSVSMEHFGGRNYAVAHAPRGSRRNMKRLEVGEGLFLLGDNRNLARDSRDYGTVDPKECLGRAIFLFEPAQNNGGLNYDQRRFKWIE